MKRLKFSKFACSVLKPKTLTFTKNDYTNVTCNINNMYRLLIERDKGVSWLLEGTSKEINEGWCALETVKL